MPAPTPLDRSALLALLDTSRPSGAAGLWIGALLGPVHRLAWDGPDDAGHRERCLELLRSMVASCQDGDAHDQRLATLVDWWLHATRGWSVLGRAFHVVDVLPDPSLHEPLSRLAHAGTTALAERTRPHAFQQAITDLEERLEAIPAIKKAPGPELYGEGREDAIQLLNLARARRPPKEVPPLRLLTADVEAWASETRGTQALDAHLKVWNSLVKHLQVLQDHARRLLALWTTEGVQPSGLPLDWADRLRDLGGPYVDLLPALLVDLAALDGPVPEELRAPLQPAWTLDALAHADLDLDESLRVRLLAVYEEARALTTRAAPPWVESTLGRLDELRLQIRALRAEAHAAGVPEAGGNLDEALNSLLRFELGESEQWIQFAREELRLRREDAEQARVRQDIAQRVAALEELGDLSGAAQPDEPPAQHLARLDRLRDQHATALQASLQSLRGQALPRPLERSVGALLDEAARRLERGTLPAAARVLREAEEQLLSHRASEERRLLPAARRLRARAEEVALHDDERKELLALTDRISLCAADGLPVAGLLEAGEALVEAAARDALHELAVLVLVGDPPPLQRQRPVTLLAWSDSGIRFSAQRLPDTGVLLPADHSARLEEGGVLRVVRCRAGWVEADGRTLALASAPTVPPEGRWHDVLPVESTRPLSIEEIRAYDGAHDLSDTVFLACQGAILGPYRPDDETVPHPADPRGFVGRLEREAFDALFGRLDLPRRAGQRGRTLVHVAPDLETLLQQDAEPVDQLDPSHLQVWLAELAADLDPETVGRLSRVVATFAGGGQALPRVLLDARLQGLNDALQAARSFERARQGAVEDFLRTPEAKAMLEARARHEIAARVDRLSGEVQARRAELEGELDDVNGRLGAARGELAAVAEQVEAERARLETRAADLKGEVEDLESLRNDRKARLLTELLGARAVNPATPARDEAGPPRAEPLVGAQTPPLGELVEQLQRILPAWSHEEVANLVLTLLTSRWTLLAGPPGVGKSTFARSVLRGLGHGPGSARYLELVVRHEWQDDAPLFGFWHPERGAWVPSSEGFVEQLIRAAHDQAESFGGLYTMVLEELNLAAPEYYLARPISAFEDERPVIRLYGDDVQPTNRDVYPGFVPVGDNVRLIGTVNVDDTVQRLSPRFLSRAGVIWMDPSLETLFTPAAPLPQAPAPVDWSALGAGLDRSWTEVPGSIRRVVEHLHERRVPGAPSPRTLRGIERYLAAAHGVLSPAVAADLQVCQRVLPSIRGVGSAFRVRLDDLAALLRTHQMPRAAARTQRLRERGEALGDYYDMFHV